MKTPSHFSPPCSSRRWLRSHSSRTEGQPPFVEARWIGFGDTAAGHVDSRFAFRKKLELAAKPTEGRVAG